MKHFKEEMLGWVCSRAFRRTRVIGYVFLGLMSLAFYVEVVNVANTVGRPDLIESLSLSDSRGTVSSVFGMGDLLTFSARVIRGNAYSLDIYDESTRVLTVNGSQRARNCCSCACGFACL